MRVIRWFVLFLAFASGGCATVQPSHEAARQALAPGGSLRVAFLAGPLYGAKDAGTGEFKGVAVDLGRALADRVKLPMQAVAYSSPPALLAAGKAGEWDVAFMGVSAERAAVVDFSAPTMEVEQGYMARAGSAIESASDVDRAGVRIGVIEKSGADVLLSSTIRNATLVRAGSTGDLEKLLGSGKADVIAATKALLYGRLPSQPGAKVLDGRILVEPIAIAVPRGRDPLAAATVAQFAEEAKRSGQVKAAIERAGLRGVVVAPMK